MILAANTSRENKYVKDIKLNGQPQPGLVSPCGYCEWRDTRGHYERYAQPYAGCRSREVSAGFTRYEAWGLPPLSDWGVGKPRPGAT